jgi:hypothetical protein
MATWVNYTLPLNSATAASDWCNVRKSVPRRFASSSPECEAEGLGIGFRFTVQGVGCISVGGGCWKQGAGCRVKGVGVSTR